jgi:hypothetical protein
MINFNKKPFTIALMSALMFAGCSNTNKLIVPDGAKRVPINRDTTTIPALIKNH